MAASDDKRDLELIQRIAKGDQSAIQPLFARYNVALFRFLMGMLHNEAIAEEVVNETFLDIWRGAGKFEGKSSPSSWMFAIARNKAISLIRKRSDLALDEEKAANISDDADTPEQTALKTDKAALIKKCMEALSPKHREIINLVYYQEKSIREVSYIVGIPENTVKTRMFNARKQLSVEMKTRGVDRGWP